MYLMLASLLLLAFPYPGEEASYPIRKDNSEIPHTRRYFYAGGHYADDGAGGHIFKEQSYVEHLAPHTITKKHPIVFIHGQAQTGTVRYHFFLLLFKLHLGYFNSNIRSELAQ